jgi:hypothetical protein
MAASDSEAPLKIEQSDRRWLIPCVTRVKKPRAYWDKLNYWLEMEHGLEIIRHWSDNFKDYVLQGEEAPDTSMKKKVVEASLSEWQLVVRDYVEMAKEKKNSGGPLVIHDRSAVDAILTRLDFSSGGGKYAPKPQSIVAELEENGFVIAGFRKVQGVRTRRLSLGCDTCESRRNLGEADGRGEREWRCDECGMKETIEIWGRRTKQKNS